MEGWDEHGNPISNALKRYLPNLGNTDLPGRKVPSDDPLGGKHCPLAHADGLQSADTPRITHRGQNIIEQFRIEIAPLLGLVEIVDVPTISVVTFVGIKVPRNPKRQAGRDRPKQG